MVLSTPGQSSAIETLEIAQRPRGTRVRSARARTDHDARGSLRSGDGLYRVATGEPVCPGHRPDRDGASSELDRDQHADEGSDHGRGLEHLRLSAGHPYIVRATLR